LTRYDLWFFAVAFLLLAFLLRWGRKLVALQLCAMATIAIGWSLWTYLNMGDPLGWYRLESSMTGWDIRYFAGSWDRNLSQLWRFGRSEPATNVLTFFIGIAASAWLLARGARPARILAFLYLVYAMFVSLQVAGGASLPEPKYLADAFPLSIATSVVAVGSVTGWRVTLLRGTKGAALILVVLFPLNQTWINFPTWPPLGVFAYKTYAVEPERDVGFWLAQNYRGGRILSDSPTVIYYSYPAVPVGRYLATDTLGWYPESNWNGTMLTQWVKRNHVRFLVWQNTSYSTSWWMFPRLSDGNDHLVGDLRFHMIHDGTRVYRDRTIVIMVYEIRLTR